MKSEIEREKKYLVNYLPIDIDKSDYCIIEQIYPQGNLEEQLRYRAIKQVSSDNNIIAEHFVMTFKRHINEIERDEIEIPVEGYFFKKLMDLSTYPRLSKKRFLKDGWDIDIYPFGLVVAEYEFSEDNPLPDPLPEWIGMEITGHPYTSNIEIANLWNSIIFNPSFYFPLLLNKNS